MVLDCQGRKEAIKHSFLCFFSLTLCAAIWQHTISLCFLGIQKRKIVGIQKAVTVETNNMLFLTHILIKLRYKTH